MFSKIKKQVRDKFDEMLKNKTHIFTVDADRTKIWETYLEAFIDPVEKQGHNCNCCKSFLRQFGSIVTIEDNKMVSIWDVIDVDPLYAPSISALSAYIHSLPVANVFFNDFAKLGTDKNVDAETKELWQHFYVELPKTFVLRKDAIDTTKAGFRDSKNVFKRGLDELTVDAFDTVLELIAQNSLYRGAESKANLDKFLALKKKYDKLPAEEKDNFAWMNSITVHESVSKIRNTAIGTLLIDISKGEELDKAVSAFERVVAPANYKRPTSLVTPKMVEQAKKTLEELGYLDSLDRRYATLTDINVNNVIFTDKSSQVTDVFGEMSKDVVVNPKSFSKLEEVSIQDFIEKIVPKAKSIEVLFENNHINNMVSLLTATNKDAPSMFKWNNPFSWSYTGGITDSLKERVIKAGGRVDGIFRFTHSWNEIEPNQSLMDLHVFMPGNEHKYQNNVHDYYGTGRRVGWNMRNDTASGGTQDVDYTSVAPVGYIPVENITFPNLKKMPEGKYICKIHNWSYRNSGGKGKAQIEFDGQVFDYVYPKTKNKEWVTIAEVTLKDGQFSIEHKLDQKQTSVQKWNLKTNQFYKVKNLMYSPNYWDGAVGNKHYLFNLENCVADESPRPFFNEFLKEDLTKDRKVFEVLGGKVKVPDSKQQLSGIGFSETQRNSVIVKVEGSFKRQIRVII